MKIAIGADHAGFQAKARLSDFLRRKKHQVLDVGTDAEESVDYPDYAKRVGEWVAKGASRRGILICGTGIGMCISANKVKGVRAAVVWNTATAKLAAEHNDANVLCLSARFLSGAQRASLAQAWLTTAFGGGRHARRIRKIKALEAGL